MTDPPYTEGIHDPEQHGRCSACSSGLRDARYRRTASSRQIRFERNRLGGVSACAGLLAG